MPGLALSPQAASLAVLRHKYAAPGELTPHDVNRRVARALAEAEVSGERQRWAACFEQALQAGFIPAGRILAGAGRQPVQPLINCFVQPLGPAHPAPGSPLPPLAQALAQAARTLALGGGVGLDFSALAPGEVLPALQDFDRAAQVGVSPHAAARPGALMGVLRVDHPDLAAFIDAKAAGGLTHFNLSVGLTDALMRQVEAGDPEAQARLRHLVQSARLPGAAGCPSRDTPHRHNSLALA